jgi:ABC-type nitrate/sulfonate/bicarbonate transport system substrate-binding protein
VTPLEVIVFPGGFNWPLFVAQDTGLFATHGLSVRVTPTPNSIFQLTGLIRGDFDIAMTAIDNVIAYQAGQGAAPLDREPDAFAFMGADTGFLSLIVQPDVAGFADLRGKTLSVDAMTTGYAFVLYEMLRLNGLARGDYALDPAGGMIQRYTALTQGRHAGTLVSTPYDVLAEAAGLRCLASARAVLPPYQGNVGAARRSWAAANGDTLVAYIKAYLAALDWLFDPANRAAAIAILCRNLPTMTGDLAHASAARLLHPSEGLFRRGALDLAGVRTVLDLRRRHAQLPDRLAYPAPYVDLRWYDQALGGA